MGSEEEEYTHSSFLFFKGDNPMQFSLRPCDEREKLKPFVEHGGGTITHRSTSQTIRLATPGSNGYTDNCISTKWVWDCIKENKQLPMEKYRVRQRDEASDMSDIEEKEVEIKFPKKSKLSLARREYLYSDDMAIINYLYTHRRIHEVKARAMWQDMERAKVVKDRSWQSLKERYRKQIKDNISKYNLPKAQLNYMKQELIQESPEPIQYGNQGNSYNKSEDLAMINYVLQENDFDAITGNVFWKTFKAKKILDRTWQSMKERFTKYVVLELEKYEIPKIYKKRAEILQDRFGRNPEQSESADEVVKTVRVTEDETNVRTGAQKAEIVETNTSDSENEEETPERSIRLDRRDIIVIDRVQNEDGDQKFQISWHTNSKEKVPDDENLKDVLSDYVVVLEDELKENSSKEDAVETYKDQIRNIINCLIDRKHSNDTSVSHHHLTSSQETPMQTNSNKIGKRKYQNENESNTTRKRLNRDQVSHKSKK